MPVIVIFTKSDIRVVEKEDKLLESTDLNKEECHEKSEAEVRADITTFWSRILQEAKYKPAAHVVLPGRPTLMQ